MCSSAYNHSVLDSFPHKSLLFLRVSLKFQIRTLIFSDFSFITLLLIKERLRFGHESVEVLVCGADFWVLLVFVDLSAKCGDDRRQLLRGDHVVLVVACDRVGDDQLSETLVADLALVVRMPGHGGDGYHQAEVVLYM